MKRLIAFFMMACLAVAWPGLSAQDQPENLDLERIRSATVMVMQARDTGDELVVTCVGSGTIVSRTGLILTNAHNTVAGKDCSGDTLVIALAARPDEPPIPKFRAEVAQADIGLDLAILRITQKIDGRLLPEGALALPFVELADSSLVRLDDTILAVGYPGVGNDPVTVERGAVRGFVAEPSGGDRAWIKTSAAIRGTMSGGGAYNLEGKLIGIPTTAPNVSRDFGTNCQPVQDTNHDGLVNASDICIPIGGFVNSIRSSNFVRPLLRASQLELTVEPLSASQTVRSDQGLPTFSRIFFSPSVIDGMPTAVIRSLPTGSNSLYLFFDYANMIPETIYELRVTIDGEPDQIFSLAPVRWSGASRGLWYIGMSGQPLANGVYEFTLVANGIASEAKRLVVGGSPQPEAEFSNIVFGLEDLRGNVLGNGYVLPTGNTATGRFIFQNMADGMDWTAVWFYVGKEYYRSTNVWTSGVSGAATTGIQDVNGLPPGDYRLELYIGNSLAATADFTIAGAQQGAFPQVFSNVAFVASPNPQEALDANPISSLSNTVGEFYVRFDWQQIAPGTLWAMRWLVDSEPFYTLSTPWSGTLSGENFVTRLSGKRGVPDGTYSVDLLVNGVRLDSKQIQVGIGQLPIDRFAQAEGVGLRGQILDANTRSGVPGVSFILLSGDFSVADFEWNQNQIYAIAVTDRVGRFQLDRPLEFGVPYSVIVSADGYLPITEDGLEVNPETASPLELTILLTRG